MLTDFDVSNFRGIRELRLRGLKQVNVVAGKNSAGKTSLLEALFVHAGLDNLALAVTLNAQHGLSWFGPDMEQSFVSLFYDGRLDERIKFIGWDKNSSWSRVELWLDKASVAPREVGSGSATTVRGARPLILDYTDSHKRKNGVSAMPQEDGTLRIQPPRYANTQRIAGIYLSSTVSSGADNVNRFAKLDAENKADLVVNALRGVEPRLKGLSIGFWCGRPVLYADLGLARKVPLNLAGEGLQKVASIALALTHCRNGILMIDEIENGFHFSVHSTIWSSIAELSSSFDVQVVASTHSFECMKAANRALKSAPDVSFGLVRLDRQEDGTVSTQEYDKELFSAAMESDIEVR